MAPIRVGCTSRTEQTIRRFSPDISFNPILLLGFCIEAFYAIIRYITRLTAQAGRKPLARDKNLSFSSEVYDSEAWNPYLLSRSKSGLKQNNPLIRMDDRQRTALERGSAKMNSLPLDHRDNSDKTSLHGIQNIFSLQANCGSKNLDKAAAKTKGNIGFLRGLGRFIQFSMLRIHLQSNFARLSNCFLFQICSVSRKFTPAFFPLDLIYSSILLDCQYIRDFVEQRNGITRRRVSIRFPVSTVMCAKIFASADTCA